MKREKWRAAPVEVQGGSISTEHCFWLMADGLCRVFGLGKVGGAVLWLLRSKRDATRLVRRLLAEAGKRC